MKGNRRYVRLEWQLCTVHKSGMKAWQPWKQAAKCIPRCKIDRTFDMLRTTMLSKLGIELQANESLYALPTQQFRLCRQAPMLDVSIKAMWRDVRYQKVSACVCHSRPRTVTMVLVTTKPAVERASVSPANPNIRLSPDVIIQTPLVHHGAPPNSAHQPGAVLQSDMRLAGIKQGNVCVNVTPAAAPQPDPAACTEQLQQCSSSISHHHDVTQASPARPNSSAVLCDASHATTQQQQQLVGDEIANLMEGQQQQQQAESKEIEQAREEAEEDPDLLFSQIWDEQQEERDKQQEEWNQLPACWELPGRRGQCHAPADCAGGDVALQSYDNCEPWATLEADVAEDADIWVGESEVWEGEGEGWDMETVSESSGEGWAEGCCRLERALERGDNQELHGGAKQLEQDSQKGELGPQQQAQEGWAAGMEPAEAAGEQYWEVDAGAVQLTGEPQDDWVGATEDFAQDWAQLVVEAVEAAEQQQMQHEQQGLVLPHAAGQQQQQQMDVMEEEEEEVEIVMEMYVLD